MSKKNINTLNEDLSASYCCRRQYVATNRPFAVKRYQAIWIDQEVQILHERTAKLRYKYFAYFVCFIFLSRQKLYAIL